ncbi:hypothetical protein DUGA2_43950 [Duganella sp. HH101]|nr:hypothetical protein DUGA2_43950 [Duganella sp. HH101]
MKSISARLIFILLGLAMTMNAFADMPPMVRTKNERKFKFGDITIVQSFNSMKDPMSPEFKVRVYDKKRLLLQLSDAAFDSFYPSPNGEAVVGLSNGGWPGTAAIIFDRRGRVLLLVEHGLAEFDYCSQTSTFIKEWYDGKDPQVKFPIFDTRKTPIPGITLKDCHGQTVDLLDTISKASANSRITLRHEVNVRYGNREK